MNRIKQRLRLFWFLFVYLLVVIYTLVFPTSASWFVFYSLTLWFFLSFLSTRQSYHLTHTEKLKMDDNTYSFAFTIQNKRRYPFFLSSINIALLINSTHQAYVTSLFFSRQIESYFHSIILQRGHHDWLTLDIEGVGLFGVWVNHSRLDVPINVDVFPITLKKSESDRLLHILSPYFTQSARSLTHDYYMNEIRSYQKRDTLAGIDWKTSLKRGQWMVKEYETEEDAPVDLYFLGFDTDSFEALLSIAYTLAHELKETQKVDIYLLGLFDNTVTLQQSQSSFLTIAPVPDTQALISLSQDVLTTPSKKIIIKSKTVHVSLPLNSPLNHRIIDEDTLLQVKGGHTDRAAT